MRVIVVGGGIVGTSAAFHLARKGVATTLVDAAHPGQATAAGTGVVYPWPSPGEQEPVRAFKLGAAAHYPELVRELAADGQATGYEAVGGMSVALEGDDAEFELLSGLARRPEFAGMGPVERLEPGEPSRRFPLLEPGYRGVALGGMARLNGRVARTALFNAAEERGLRYFKGEAVLSWDGAGVGGVRVGREELEADTVIVAAGAWSARLLAPVGVELPVHPVRGQAIHLAVPGADTRRWPIVRFGEHDYFVAAFGPDRVVAGRSWEPEAGFDHRVTAGALLHNLARAVELLPGLRDAAVVETRVGFRPGTGDGLPLLGPLAGVAGLIVATGLGSQGLTLGPYQGAVAAGLALGEEPPFDLSPFRPDRP